MPGALRGPVVEVSPQAAAQMAPWLAELRRAWRRDAYSPPAELVEVVAAIDRLGRAVRNGTSGTASAQVAAGSGTSGTVPVAGLVMVEASWTVAQAAARLGVSDRAIRKRIARRTLPARRVGRCWVIDPVDLEDTA